jgi:hypothetical protein
MKGSEMKIRLIQRVCMVGMKKRFNKWVCLFAAIGILAGCGTIPVQPATVNGRVITNPTVGWSGYAFEIPDGFVKKDFLVSSMPEGTETEKMAARLFQRSWNHRKQVGSWEWERFGEAFCFSDAEGKTCFILTVQELALSYPVPMFSMLLPSEKRTIYNGLIRRWHSDLSDVQPVTIGGRQGLLTFEYGFERSGKRYVSKSGGRRPCIVASCAFMGDARDGYTIVGCADAGNADLLRENMQKIMRGFSFLN